MKQVINEGVWEVWDCTGFEEIIAKWEVSSGASSPYESLDSIHMFLTIIVVSEEEEEKYNG